MTLRKKAILIFSILNLTGCGETPTSQLSEQFPIIRSGPHNMEFAFIPKGTFRMGSPGDEEGRDNDDENLHWVKLTEDYWMQTTEVTRGQWYKVMGSYPDNNGECWERGSVVKENEHPVVCVSWSEIQEYVDKLNNQEKNSGYKYSLPTEARWEYATRSYTETPYSIKAPIESFAWYSVGRTHPVGKLKANLFGLYDVHGNVWEWVSDWYDKSFPRIEFFSDAIQNPKGPDSGTFRVLRGGCWYLNARDSRSASRGGSFESALGSNAGFRLMRVNL